MYNKWVLSSDLTGLKIPTYCFDVTGLKIPTYFVLMSVRRSRGVCGRPIVLVPMTRSREERGWSLLSSPFLPYRYSDKTERERERERERGGGGGLRSTRVYFIL